MVEGYTITLKSLKKPDIIDEDGLLRHLVKTIIPGKPMPLKINWNKKSVVTLIDSGVIPLELALVKEEKHLALQETIIEEE